MAEYIEREAALDLISGQTEIFSEPPMSYEDGIKLELSHGYYRGIEKIPAADVVEVVHSEWGIIEFNKEEGFVTVECKNCDAAFTIEMPDYGLSYNFCPSCGAKMDGERRSDNG